MDGNETFCVNDNAREDKDDYYVVACSDLGWSESEIDMAGNLPLLNGVEMKLTWLFNGQPYALNILHFNNPQGASVTQSLANSVDTAVKTALTGSGLIPVLSSLTGLVNAQIRSMTASSDPWFIGSGAAIVGGGLTPPLPAAVTFCVTNKTGLRGRSFNGRTYLWGFCEGGNDAQGGATQAVADASVLFLNNIRTSLAGATPSLVFSVLSRFTTLGTATEPTERNPPILTAVTTSVALDRRWDTQRRRAIPGV